MKELPIVSIIIPCRNEERFIGPALDSLLSNDYPKDKYEILVVNGASTDKTKEIADSYAKRFPSIGVLENPKKITPISMNIGVKNAKGDLVTKTDSHTIYPKDYISKCVKYLYEYEADAVGGIAYPVPSKPTLTARAIALTLSSFFGAGNSKFRTGSEKPIWVDTAFGTFYRKEVFRKVGLFNENLVRSQDMELNLRLKNSGGKILLIPDLILKYHPKATFLEFFKHNFADGVWTILPMKFGAPRFRLRHLMPLIFVFTITLLSLASFIVPLQLKSISLSLLTAALASYFLVSFLVSLGIALRQKEILLVPFLITAFAVRHFGYGLGSMVGLFKLIK